VTPESASDNRSSFPLRREVYKDSYQGVTPPECVQRNDIGRAWNQNFTNSGNEGNQNANNKDNTNNSVRPARRLSHGAANLTITEVLQAYEDCRKNKRNNSTTLEFEHDFLPNLLRIFREIENHTWKPSGHMCFAVRSPKVREVWASPFADRVVHHVIYNRLRPRFEKDFIGTTFACIPGRGTGAAADWAERSARKVTQHWSRPAYVLQVDIKNFFPSIDCYSLRDKLMTKVTEPWLAHLVNEIILVNVKDNAHFPGDPQELNLVSKEKSLWTKPHGVGLPIGNLTSQFGANVLLDELDQHMVRGNFARHYGRYVDDIVLLDSSKEKLQIAILEIKKKLLELGHFLNKDKTYLGAVNFGFDFCGRFVLPFRSYLRKITRKRGNIGISGLAGNAHPAETVTSYLGLARHCHAYNLRAKWAKIAIKNNLTVDFDLTKAMLKDENT